MTYTGESIKGAAFEHDGPDTLDCSSLGGGREEGKYLT